MRLAFTVARMDTAREHLQTTGRKTAVHMATHAHIAASNTTLKNYAVARPMIPSVTR